ncbi:MAG: DUF4920 domain-containing protein [Nonlabens sp.]|jgi:hypothetical protein|uniref:DUF4920 domain-containing protein n=3 Tax=Nonlabens sp. TaxID=1888209 RepID=UPI003219AF45
MKRFITGVFALTLLVGCKEPKQEEEMPAVNDEQVQEMAYMDYGAEFSNSDVIDAMELGTMYKTMKVGDTTTVKVKGTIADVCVKKGCWIKMPVGDASATVKFKDYGFFLPKNGKGKEVILSGKAYKNITPVEELRHYAEDAGKSEEEIAAITEEEVTLSFIADGAMVEEFDNPDVEGVEKTEE